MPFKLVFGKQNFQELLISHLVSMINPIFKMLESIWGWTYQKTTGFKGKLKWNIKYPILLLAASSDEIYCFAG